VWRGTILVFGIQRCNHTLYIGHQIQIRMRLGLLRLIRERLAVFVGNCLHGGIGDWINYRIFQSGSLEMLWIWLCHLIENMSFDQHLCYLFLCQLEVGAGIRILLITCIGSYLPSSIPSPPEEQSMLPLTFFLGNGAKMLGYKDV
jgi:hypothetical protein